jgi:ABC-type nickel/cobalt efflux system permease component RcnA
LGFDEWVAGPNLNVALAFFAALLLGLRHATDPDHLTAISTLVLSNRGEGPSRAGWLGLAWGLGHALTLVGFGLPVVLFARGLPDAVLNAAEVGIGLLIIFLAARLLVRWKHGLYHGHPHSHAGVLHTHLHVHEGKDHHDQIPHVHSHAEALGRSPLAAFGIGMLHGLGGSSGVGMLLVGAASTRMLGVTSLILFAAGTAVSMAIVSAGFGYLLTRGAVARRARALVPLLASASLFFGVWYTLTAMGGPALRM